MVEIINDRPCITIDFTVDEMVKLLSCCNQAIVNIEDAKHYDGFEALRPSYNGVTLQGSLDKVWDVKTKLKNAITTSLGQSTNGTISVSLDITEWIKLNGCCNAAIEMEEKTISLLPSTSKCIPICKETIQSILDIKYKIKTRLNAVYGSILYGEHVSQKEN